MTRPLLMTLPLLLACGDKETDDSQTPTDSGDDSATDSEAPSAEAYSFPSKFTEGSSVSYEGQIFRHLLIDDMKTHLGKITGRIDTGSFFPVPGDVALELEFYFAFDSAAYGDLEHGKTTDPAAAQTTYNELATGKDLIGKLAGNDAKGQHEDWSTQFVGWTGAGISTPETLVASWFATIDAQAVARANGDIPLDPSGQPISAVYLDAQGRDYQQLLEKFLRGAVAFSQGTDDYLDDDLDDHGLNSNHLSPEEGQAYTALEHAWDEGFGYFGASATYGAWTDAQIADTPALDWNEDGAIDLVTELCWGHSGNAAKRDLGSVVATDFTAQAWTGFYEGRALLAATAGQELSADQAAELRGYRDQAIAAWEAAIAASVVHYINELLVDMAGMNSEAYSFADHAKHWSEMKGFALSFQFNPRSPLSDEDFVRLHTLLGQAPVLPSASSADQEAYAEALREARALLGVAYGFPVENLGDEGGQGGW